MICKLLIMQFFYTSFKIHFMIVCKQITFLTHFIFPVSVNGKILLQQFQPIINTRFKSLLRWDQSEIEVRPNFESVRCEREVGWFCPCRRSSCLNWVILPRIERMELNLRKFLALDSMVDTQRYLQCYIPEWCLKDILQFIQQWFKRNKFRLTQIILLFLLQTVLVLLNQKLIDL